MSDEKVKIFVGNIIHSTGLNSLQVLENGFIVVKGQKILDLGEGKTLETKKFNLGLKDDTIDTIQLKKSQLLIPGLIDSHIHAPQYPNIGLGYDKPLLEWLQTYTYPLETQYSNLDFSRKVYKALVKQTLNHGTTTACYFASMFKESSMELVKIIADMGQRALVGKINMTRLAPEDYLENDQDSIDNTLRFIRELNAVGSQLVKPVITPRFALSVNMDLMIRLGEIARQQDLHIQTHISENESEIKMVKNDYNNMEYASVYDKAGLLTSKTVLAHGVHLTESELSLLADKGTSIAHCPDSNICLKSGACDVRRLLKFHVKVGLGTDVAGGASPSIIKAMKSALDTSISISFNKPNYEPLDYKEVFFLATLGGAQALAMDNEIGNFVPGKDFDALIVDMDVDKSGSDYLKTECTALEVLQKFIYVGDDRNVLKVYVAGQSVKH